MRFIVLNVSGGRQLAYVVMGTRILDIVLQMNARWDMGTSEVILATGDVILVSKSRGTFTPAGADFFEQVVLTRDDDTEVQISNPIRVSDYDIGIAGRRSGWQRSHRMPGMLEVFAQPCWWEPASLKVGPIESGSVHRGGGY